MQFDGGTLTHRYLHGPAVDQILADEQVDTGDILWPLTDNLGSVRDIAIYNAGTDTTSIADHIVYDAFGRVISETNSAVDLLFGYTGRDWDAQAELQYNRARWYDPKIGQWLSEDPIGFGAGDANVRRYVGNGVTGATDPSGLWEIEIVIHYHFQTIDVNEKVRKEVQRILDDAVARHGRPGGKIKVVFKKLSSEEDYHRQGVGIIKTGSAVSKVNVTLRENPKLVGKGFGNGSGFDGSLVPRQVFVDKLRDIGKAALVDEAIAGAIVHEGIFHGSGSFHLSNEGFVDSAVPDVSKTQRLSDEGCKRILKRLGSLK